MPRIAAVVVTCNRLALLQDCISALSTQTRPVDEVIVVDNSSSDGTEEWCSSMGNQFTYLRQRNLGCSGGMRTGIEEAIKRGHDWFWLMDDDTLPRPNALERFVENRTFQSGDCGFLASINRKQDGTLGNLSNPTGVENWLGTVLSDRALPVFTSSFVSLLVNRQAVEEVGLPLAGFFIWADDIEFTRRISSRFPCYAVLDSEVIHPTGPPTPDQVQLDPKSMKFWCYFRNWTAYDFFQGGGILRVGFRMLRRFIRMSREAHGPSAKLRGLLAAFDGLYLGLANREFIHPLKKIPTEKEPPVLPYPLRCQTRKSPGSRS